MNTYLLITSIVIFLCILLNRVSNRIGIPALLAFIVLGMLFGSDGIMKIDFDNYAFAEQICSTALIFIMFYGGFGTNWQRAKAVAVKSVLLSTIGVIITCFLTGLFCHFALNMSWEISRWHNLRYLAMSVMNTPRNYPLYCRNTRRKLCVDCLENYQSEIF